MTVLHDLPVHFYAFCAIQKVHNTHFIIMLFLLAPRISVITRLQCIYFVDDDDDFSFTICYTSRYLLFFKFYKYFEIILLRFLVRILYTEHVREMLLKIKPMRQFLLSHRY